MHSAPARAPTSTRLRLLLLLPGLFYLLVPLYWHHRHFYSATGDEPHYLVLADGLAHDFTVSPTAAYEREEHSHRVYTAHLDSHLVKGPSGREFSEHSLGLALLLAGPFELGGVLAARLFMALLMGLLPFLIEGVLFNELNVTGRSVPLALALSVSLPFMSGANQIYPDLPSGIIIFAACALLFAKATATEGKTSQHTTPLSLAIAFLPWLHLKNVAPTLILVAAAGAVITQRHSLRQSWPLLALPLLSMGLLFVFNGWAFGRPLAGPYANAALDINPRHFGLIVLGLHWDQAEGLFVQQPLWLLGVVGAVTFARAHPFRAVLLCALYASILLPNSMHPNWYGGYSFIGRFNWSVLLLWTFPLAAAAHVISSSSPRSLTLLCIASVSLQLIYLSEWLLHNNVLYHLQSSVEWAAQSLWPSYKEELPFFGDFARDWTRAANALVVGLTAWLLVLSSRIGRASLLRPFLWGAGATIVFEIALRLLPRNAHSFTLSAAELASNTGVLKDGSRVAVPGIDLPGALSFGPYFFLPPGSYLVDLDYRSSDGPQSNTWDLAFGGEVSVRGSLPSTFAQPGRLQVPFRVTHGESFQPMEFRLWFTGSDELSLSTIRVTQVE